MSILNIDVNHDSVIVENTYVPKPNGIAVNVWIRFWEGVKKGTYDDGYSRGYNDGERDAQDRHRGH